jgi:hypothetical protein
MSEKVKPAFRAVYRSPDSVVNGDHGLYTSVHQKSFGNADVGERVVDVESHGYYRPKVLRLAVARVHTNDSEHRAAFQCVSRVEVIARVPIHPSVQTASLFSQPIYDPI